MVVEFLLGFCAGALFVTCIMVYKEMKRIEKSINEIIELTEKIRNARRKSH